VIARYHCAMAQYIYDNPNFFAGYSELERPSPMSRNGGPAISRLPNGPNSLKSSSGRYFC